MTYDREIPVRTALVAVVAMIIGRAWPDIPIAEASACAALIAAALDAVMYMLKISVWPRVTKWLSKIGSQP